MSAKTAIARSSGASFLFVMGLGIGQICSWGSLYYSFPLIAEVMGQDLGWSKTEIYGAASLGLALAGLASYPVGAAIDRGRGRPVMALGSAIAGLLLVIWSQTSSMAVFYVAAAGIGALQAATLYEPAFAVVARRAGATRARAGITALTLYGGFASTVFIPLVQLLLSHLGWRDTLLVLGGINIALCPGIYAVTIDPRADIADRLSASAPPEGGAAVAAAMRRPAFWALAVAFTAFSATFAAFTFHIYPLLIERGLDGATVVAALAMIGPAQVAGRIVIWVFLSGASVRLIGSIVVLAFPIALAALAALPPSFALVAGVAVLYGAANGIMTIVRGMAVPEMITRHAYGAVNGAISTPSNISRALAPAGAAFLWSLSGSYGPVLLTMLIGSFVLAIAFWIASAISARHLVPAT